MVWIVDGRCAFSAQFTYFGELSYMAHEINMVEDISLQQPLIICQVMHFLAVL